MKNAMITLTMIFSLSTFAKTVVKIPEINFGSTAVTVDKLCVDGNDIRTVAPVTFCSNYERTWVSDGPRRSEGHFEVTCTEYSTEVLSRSIDYTAQKCVRYQGRRSDNECIKYQDVTKTLALSYNYEVVEVKRLPRGEFSETLIERRHIVINSCN